ncbi:PAS domain-containing protein [Sphingomonas sp. GB1N7]|uniref:PAS domain-containing protein n=1 Tax=Parasphingomonas caseinilytica TaxID=3096158 RepID=UPI002FC760A7
MKRPLLLACGALTIRSLLVAGSVRPLGEIAHVIDDNEQTRIVHELLRSDNGTDPFSSAVRATRMPMIITDPKKVDNPIVFANAAFSKLTGFDRQEILGRNCRFLQGPNTDASQVERVRAAVRDRTSVEVELLNYRKDGSHFWNRLLVSPVFDDDGGLAYFFASQFDVTMERERLSVLESDRAELEREIDQRTSDLVHAEQRLGFALEAGRLGSWSVDFATNRMVCSERSKKNFGRPLDQPFTYDQLLEAVHPDDRVHRDAAVDAAIKDAAPYDVEYRIITPAGEERWIHARGQAYHRADGTPLSLVGTSQDITQRKRADEHRALLANELSHRVKNMLTTLQALISQTLRSASTLDDAENIISGRIQAMASANDLLVNERWESAPLRELVARTLAPFEPGQSDRLAFEGPDVQVSPRIAGALSLALHELATNAAKYGALSTAEGSVSLHWSVADMPEQSNLRISWEEAGGPKVAPPQKTGFGSQLIKRVLAHEIGGSVDIEYRETGVKFTAVAPMPDISDDDHLNSAASGR